MDSVEGTGPETPPQPHGGQQPPTSARPSHKAAKVGGAAARGIKKGGVAAYSSARKFTHSGGAGESGLSRLLELHAFNTAGDAAIAVSLAGTLFFTVPSDEAAGQVALFLAVTMLPFAFIAPLIGPFLDRFRRGRRWAIGATLALRAFFAWILAGAVTDQSTTFFIAALGCLVSSKAYGVTRAAAVPRLLPTEFTLVKANSRVSLTGTGAAAISGPIALGLALIGSEWTLRYAFLLFTVGTILAILLPAKVDSSEGEEQIDDGLLSDSLLVPPSVVLALRANAGLRILAGFLTIYMAFVLRDPPDSLGWSYDGTILMALVIGGAGAGSTIGVLIGNLTKSRSPRFVVLATLAIDVAMLTFVALFLTWSTAALLGVTVGTCQTLGKLSLDAIIQRDVRESVRTSVFARSETLIQLSWVTGGLIGIGLFTVDATPKVSLLVMAALLIAWLVHVLRNALAKKPSHQESSQADEDGNGQHRRDGDTVTGEQFGSGES